MASWHELVVEEQNDKHGEIVYAVILRTYSKRAIEHLARVLGNGDTTLALTYLNRNTEGETA